MKPSELAQRLRNLKIKPVPQQRGARPTPENVLSILENKIPSGDYLPDESMNYLISAAFGGGSRQQGFKQFDLTENRGGLNSPLPGPRGIGVSGPAGEPSLQNENIFSGEFSGYPGYQEAVNEHIRRENERISQGETRLEGNITSRANLNVSQAGNLFKGVFRNYVGRDPAPEEYNQFFRQIVVPQSDVGAPGSPAISDLRNPTVQFIHDTFRPQAQEQAKKEIQSQVDVAAELGEKFRGMGRQAISDTEASLQDFVQRTFERIRPNLMTSLKSQNLLNTGGLNEALTGTYGDLARGAQGFLAQAKLANEQEANRIAFSGASAPYEFSRGQAFARVPYLQSAGQQAISDVATTRANELEYERRLGLLDFQRKLLPEDSLLEQYGGKILGGISSGFGQSLGSAGFASLGPLGTALKFAPEATALA